MIALPSTIAARPALLRDILSLAKPRITMLVLATTTAGLFLAPGRVDIVRALITLIATTGVVAAANTLNCYLERDIDGLMERTRNRPLPAGRLDSRLALWFGLLLSLISIPILAVAINATTGLLALTALISYVLVYTPMKQWSPKALVVGAIPGAIPPLLGWTAATGRIGLPGALLFAILFLWQLPHFLAIAVYRKEEYARAGFAVLPVVRDEATTRRHILFYILVLVPISLAFVPLGTAGFAYGSIALVLGALFFYFGIRRAIDAPLWARQLFLFSLVYLPVLLGALVLNLRR